MANSFLKANQIASQALGLLQRDIVLPNLVWANAAGDFTGAANDTVSLRVPARLDARTRTLRDNTSGLLLDQLAETKVDISLTTDVYSGVPVTDENLTLDISNFGAQVLAPQVRAVAEGVENAVANLMEGATYATTLTLDSTDAWNTVMAARNALNKAYVPMTDRYLVVGSDVELAILKSSHLNTASGSGDSMAQGIIRDASIGRIGGFDVYVSMALPPTHAYAFHRTAYVLGMRAPVIPSGVAYGSSQSYQGLALRWLRDYDPFHQTDRSFVNTWIGTNTVADGPNSNLAQTVTITGTPTGGSFSLTYAGNTTGAIAYNATAANVKSALVSLPGLTPNDVTVTGGPGPGTPYVVTLGGADAYNEQTFTATGSFTGGTSPAVAVTGGVGTPTFVRAVKIQ